MNDTDSISIQSKGIVRTRLHEKVYGNLEKKIITIVAPAGYGKSTLLSQFLCESKKNHAIIRIPEASNFTFQSFIKYFINSLSNCEHCSGLVFQKTKEFLAGSQSGDSDKTDLIIDSVQIILSEMEPKLNSSFYIAFDDIQYLNNPEWLEDFIKYFCDFSGVRIKLILSSRSELPFNLIGFKSKRELFSMTISDLKFDLREIEELAAGIYDIKLSDKELNFLNKKFEGWITGLPLFLQEYDSSNKAGVDDHKITDFVYEYFAEIVF
ncbi:MAG: AAA family ATPase [Bacteroidota bacterium]|nr:AAA family ATPase [Bacteroidota bacterium]